MTAASSSECGDWRYNCLSMWMAGFGAKRGFSLGRPDDDCSNVTANPVHMHDLQATILRCLGVDHRQLRYKYQGRVFRRTDVSGEAACAYRYT